jgi:hypothetical protein
MTEHSYDPREQPPGGGHAEGVPPDAERRPQSPEEFDRDLDLKAIVWTTVGIAGMTIVSAVLMMVMMRLFSHADARQGATLPAPPRVAAAAPPEPRLQESARVDMEAMRAREELDLEHASWLDAKQGTVRLPIEVAIDLVAARGLPATPATGASTSIDRGPTNQPSPGTVLPAPGQGVGQLGPSAAAPVSLSGATLPATDEPARPPLLATPAPAPASAPATAPRPPAPVATSAPAPAPRPPAPPATAARPPAARPPAGEAP